VGFSGAGAVEAAGGGMAGAAGAGAGEAGGGVDLTGAGFGTGGGAESMVSTVGGFCANAIAAERPPESTTPKTTPSQTW